MEIKLNIPDNIEKAYISVKYRKEIKELNKIIKDNKSEKAIIKLKVFKQTLKTNNIDFVPIFKYNKNWSKFVNARKNLKLITKICG